jgi:hydrogenase maturation protease
MQAGRPAGTVYRFGIEDVAESEVIASLHQVSLRAALRFAPAARPAIAILGVEPLTIAYGLDLSSPVEAALPLVVSAARQIIAEWRSES